jgi:hypothetical protein
VSRELVLDRAHIDHAEILEPPKYPIFAEAMVSAIEEFEHTDEAGVRYLPFSVFADPYPCVDEPKRHLVAHALIKLAALPTKGDRTIAIGLLARVAFNPIGV